MNLGIRAWSCQTISFSVENLCPYLLTSGNSGLTSWHGLGMALPFSRAFPHLPNLLPNLNFASFPCKVRLGIGGLQGHHWSKIMYISLRRRRGDSLYFFLYFVFTIAQLYFACSTDAWIYLSSGEISASFPI